MSDQATCDLLGASYRQRGRIEQRIPPRQAASLHRRRHGEFRRPVPDGDFPIQRAPHGTVPHLADRNNRVRRVYNRFQPVDLVLHPHASCRSFRHRNPVHRAGREFFQTVRPGFIVIWWSKGSRADIPVGLVSTCHRRAVRKGAGNAGALA